MVVFVFTAKQITAQTNVIFLAVGNGVNNLIQAAKVTCPEGDYIDADIDPREKTRMESERLSMCSRKEQKVLNIINHKAIYALNQKQGITKLSSVLVEGTSNDVDDMPTKCPS